MGHLYRWQQGGFLVYIHTMWHLHHITAVGPHVDTLNKTDLHTFLSGDLIVIFIIQFVIIVISCYRVDK